MSQPTTIELLMQRINEHIQVEDDATAATAKANPVATVKRVAGKVNAVGQEANRPKNSERELDHSANCNNRGKGHRNDRADYPRVAAEDAKRNLNARTGITMVFKIPIYRIFSEIRDMTYAWFSAKLGDTQMGFNLRYRCNFHVERGYRTEDYLPLKQHLEELVATDHLDRYIDRGVKAVPQALAEPNSLVALDAPVQGIINVIHGIVEPTRVCELWGMIKKAEHIREVLSVQPAVKRGNTEVKDVLRFSSQDLDHIQMPHNDALVVTLHMKDFDIRHILIEQGSSIEVMHYDPFK
ncbi:uncharacterized protein LOC114302741 [Camellia sinensis]|uniref:uncharacterized protein LOC114302741 n=1 Tax=Camellia sinensis TaxID=4442 RepID=UPI0010363363|nr:uncharacterized protein LOC114302741 [Camellia sinensis]